MGIHLRRSSVYSRYLFLWLSTSFCQLSSPVFFKQYSSALRHPDFVLRAIFELLDNGCIVEHSSLLFELALWRLLRTRNFARWSILGTFIAVSFVLVWVRGPSLALADSSGRALVLYLGPQIWIPPCWYFSGTPEVSIGFAWPLSGGLKYSTFTVLPFGLSSACFCFANCCVH